MSLSRGEPSGRPLRAVVAAGGTEEAIDDVRVLSNLSSGRFGAAIARALVRQGVATRVLASRRLAATDQDLAQATEVVPFRGIDDLARELAALADDPPDLLFMAAAVSDYAPQAATGKMSSADEELVLRLTKTPKLLSRLRGSLGPLPVLVGFKLLSHVPAAELHRVAQAQVRNASLDLTVANDLAELGGDRHPIWLVRADGTPERFDGDRDDVAEGLVARALAVAAARPGTDAWPASELARRVGEVADRLGYARDARAVRVHTPDEPALLLDAVEGVEAVVMVDDALGRLDASLRCEDATSDEAVRSALAEAARAGRWAGGAFAVGIEGGGVVFGLMRRTAAGWGLGFDAAVAALRAEVPEASGHPLTGARPLFDGANLVGVAVPHEEGAIAPFVIPRARRRGVGDAVAEQLAERGSRLACRSSDAPYFFQRGFVRRGASVGPVGVLWVLDPPDEAAAIPAASVALVDVVRRRVLLGRRTSPPWEGYWAFPGGKLELGEASEDTARRELEEETGIVLPTEATPRLWTKVLTSDGERLYRVENLAYWVLRADSPRSTPELEAAWVPLGAAAALRPMAAGTRRIVARLIALVERGGSVGPA